MKHILILLTVLALTLVLTSCDNITDQEDLTPGGRNYKWTVDTILTNQSYGYYYDEGKIYGSSSAHLWYMCSSLGELWEFRSGKWAKVNFVGFYPSKFFNTGNHALVISQDRRYCIFNGATFGEIKNMGISSNVYINGIYGASMSDIYAVGYKYENSVQKGVLLHFNGSVWTERVTEYLGSFTNISKGSNSGILINYSAYYTGSGILEYDGRNFKRISNNNYSSFILGDKIFLRDGGYLYKYNEGKIYQWKSLNSYSSGIICGRSESDMFYISYGLTHYNGNDIVLLYPTSNMNVLDCKIINNAVHCLVYEHSNSQVQLITGTYK